MKPSTASNGFAIVVMISVSVAIFFVPSKAQDTMAPVGVPDCGPGCQYLPRAHGFNKPTSPMENGVSTLPGGAKDGSHAPTDVLRPQSTWDNGTGGSTSTTPIVKLPPSYTIATIPGDESKPVRIDWDGVARVIATPGDPMRATARLMIAIRDGTWVAMGK